MELLKTVEWISDIPGVSGDEGAVRAAIEKRLAGRCELRADALGNLIAFKKGKKTPKNRLLLSAHMDEVGFIITHIEDSGLLRVASCGGIDGRVAVGRPVEVGDARIPGVIGQKALHHAGEKEREAAASLDKLTIDIGAESREDAEKVVLPGDGTIFVGPFQRLGDDKIMGRAFDDRAGCALLIHLLESDLPYDCHFSFTVQEESGCTGGVTAGYGVDPDIAIAVETTTASDIAGVSPDKVVCRLGGGPVVSFMDRGTVYDKELYQLGLSTAKELGIPAQTKEGVFGGNESRSLQVAREGARVMAVSMPCRYLHSPSNVLQESDIHDTYKLLEALVDRLANR